MFVGGEPHKLALRELEDALKLKDPGACLMALVTSPSNSASLDTVYVPTKLTKAVLELKNEGCNNLYVLIYAFGGSIYFPEIFEKVVRGIGIDEIAFIVPTRSGANASLLILSNYNKLYVNSWTIMDPFNITISVPPAAPKDISLFLGISEYLMSLVKGEKKDLASQISGQALSIMASHGILYEYIEAERLLNYLDTIIENKIKPKLKVSLQEFKDSFVGTEERPPVSLSGLEVAEMFKDVVVMDREEAEIGRLSNNLENLLMEMVESRGAGGVLLTRKREVLIGGVPVIQLPS
ncbi:hypothetical protein [Ignicoccus hospitalis]|uniref:Uncharacterized protein n=1 Tax=Ignicoccus hospitalis (strain KIN4/I / DSM 18386 / JCM 14125) TaxID=453591 RepID=A8A9H0_IGNH4|nr:hypothetical protein [Ignicoccus hospitalis]ABU81572.1 hypothetical protein Igni_0389 [Ignicoccus hospitalis KIN4/I]HIH90507.1 hypothetical protein [Desulfurococcaceae archaeon]